MSSTDRDTIHADRAMRRMTSARKATGLVLWRELGDWLDVNLPDGVVQGRLTGDLQVTREAFDGAPGDDVQAFTNALGDTIYRKKILVPGVPTAELRLMLIEHEGA